MKNTKTSSGIIFITVAIMLAFLAVGTLIVNLNRAEQAKKDAANCAADIVIADDCRAMEK